eukprot:485020_1
MFSIKTFYLDAMSSKWIRLGNLDDDVILTFQTTNSFGIFCCKSFSYFKSATQIWDNHMHPTHANFQNHEAHQPSIKVFDGKNKRMCKYEPYRAYAEIMDIENTTSNTFKPSKLLNNTYASGIIVNNKCHVIGGATNNGYYIWNKNSSQFGLKAELKLIPSSTQHVLLYLDSRKIILEIKTWQISSYCTITNIWSKIAIELPSGLRKIKAVVTRDDKYVLMFGGHDFGWTNDIFVLDVKMMKLLKCTVKCPVSHVIQTAILNDCNAEELITFGFVRDSWKNKQYSHILFPPFYLIKLVQFYYWKDEIHLFWNSCHWKKSVDDILNNTIPIKDEDNTF